MHMVTINNNAICDSGHLHSSSLTYSEHKHCRNYKINVKVGLAEASANFVY